MKEFIQFLVTSLVKNPQSVAVEEVQEGQNYRYNITVDPADMGIIIGKEGKTINAIRALAKAKAVKQKVWVDIRLLDSQNDQTQTEHQSQGITNHPVDNPAVEESGSVTGAMDSESAKFQEDA